MSLNDPGAVEQIKHRIAVDSCADAVMGIIDEIAEDEGVAPVEIQKQVYRILRESFEEKPEDAKPMTPAEVRAFERQPLPFGIHRGSLVKDVPIEYLQRLTDPSHFMIQLRRYINTPNVV